MKLINYDGLEFSTQELKELYEPIITKYGFEYDKGLDRDGRGLVWTKLYESSGCYDDLWPLMVIRESDYDFYPGTEDANYFSTSLYWEDIGSSGFQLGINPLEFDDDSGDELELFYLTAKDAQKEANQVLEECRQQLAAKLIEIRDQLRAELEVEE